LVAADHSIVHAYIKANIHFCRFLVASRQSCNAIAVRGVATLLVCTRLSPVSFSVLVWT